MLTTKMNLYPCQKIPSIMVSMNKGHTNHTNLGNVYLMKLGTFFIHKIYGNLHYFTNLKYLMSQGKIGNLNHKYIHQDTTKIF